ncbi:MAG: type II toxin-antitoxin system RelE/ParE family toxin, partial [Thiohalomonadales bacterium]
MCSYKVSRKAQIDLLAIGRFTSRKWGHKQRNIYLKQLDDCFTQLAENPKLGVTCDDIKKDYRKFPQGNHLIFYKQNEKSVVEIIRILHKSMDEEFNL